MHKNVTIMDLGPFPEEALHTMVNSLAQMYLFQMNTELVRDDFSRLIGSVLEMIRLRHAIYDYQIVCDETNNGPEVVERNELRFSVFVKYYEDSEFIELSTISTDTK